MLLARVAGVALAAAAALAPAGAQDVASEGLPSAPTEVRRVGDAGSGAVEFQVGYFDMPDDGAGNPFLDEELTIVEPVLILDYNVTDTFGYTLGLSYDQVSSASIDRLAKFPDQSGASGDNYYGVDLALHWDRSASRRVGGNLHLSREYDYWSLGLGGSVTTDSDDGNATTTWNANLYYDLVDVIRFDGTEEGNEDRITLSGTWGRTQALTANTQGQIGATLALQNGFLETPYNAVVIEDPMLPPNPNLENMARGVETIEKLPDTRIRGAVYGRTRTYLGWDTAGELGGRIYADDWGIASVSFEPRLYTSFFDERLLLRLRYRYYYQTESTYHEDRFFVEEDEQTQDSDLASFDSHTIGAKLTWNPKGVHSVYFGVDSIARDDGLDQFLAFVGWIWNF